MKTPKFVVLTLVLVGFAIPLTAQDAGSTSPGFPGDVPDRFRISIGSVFGSFDTNFAYSSDRGGLGAMINLEDLLDVDAKSTSFRFLGSWRFGRRSSLRASYVSFDRAGDRAPQRDFTFLGYTILAGTAVTTDFSSEMISLTYRYNAYDNNEVRLFGSAGITYMKLDTNLATGIGVIGPDGDPIIGRGIEKQGSIKAPVPHIGVGAEWAASSTVMIDLYVRGLIVDIGNFRGGITEVGVSGTWYFLRNLGLGLGLERNDIRINEYDGDDFLARGSYTQLGMTALLTAAF